MVSKPDRSHEFRACFSREKSSSDADYALVAEFDRAYAAISRAGLPALVLPLTECGAGTVGRLTTGFELVAHPNITLVHDGRRWESPAAALLCNDLELVDSFAVLAMDVVDKTVSERTWIKVTAVVEEWMSLLAPRGRPTIESELGLWGELWFLAQSSDPTSVLAGWCGPDRDSMDFFVRDVAVEVKASRSRHKHFVSQAQVDAPVGDLPAWFLSIWVKPASGQTGRLDIPALVDDILARVAEKSEALRRIARAGYSPSDRKLFTTAFTLLEAPSWFASSNVPRVRLVDPGVSRLRYLTSLDEALRADAATAMRLWSHFRAQAPEFES